MRFATPISYNVSVNLRIVYWIQRWSIIVFWASFGVCFLGSAAFAQDPALQQTIVVGTDTTEQSIAVQSAHHSGLLLIQIISPRRDKVDLSGVRGGRKLL